MCRGCQTWRQLGGSIGGMEEAEQEGRCKEGMERDQWERPSSAQHPMAVLSCCPGTAAVCPLPVYLLHITLPDGPASSQDLSHLGDDWVIVYAGHSHHFITPRARQSRAVRAVWMATAPPPKTHHDGEKGEAKRITHSRARPDPKV